MKKTFELTSRFQNILKEANFNFEDEKNQKKNFSFLSTNISVSFKKNAESALTKNVEEETYKNIVSILSEKNTCTKKIELNKNNQMENDKFSEFKLSKDNKTTGQNSQNENLAQILANKDKNFELLLDISKYPINACKKAIALFFEISNQLENFMINKNEKKLNLKNLKKEIYHVYSMTLDIVKYFENIDFYFSDNYILNKKNLEKIDSFEESYKTGQNKFFFFDLKYYIEKRIDLEKKNLLLKNELNSIRLENLEYNKIISELKICLANNQNLLPKICECKYRKFDQNNVNKHSCYRESKILEELNGFQNLKKNQKGFMNFENKQVSSSIKEDLYIKKENKKIIKNKLKTENNYQYRYKNSHGYNKNKKIKYFPDFDFQKENLQNDLLKIIYLQSKNLEK